MRIEVKCYEGYKAAEKPIEFRLEEEVYQVREILDQWYEPDAIYFKVKASDGNIYILKQGHGALWTLSSFRLERVD